MYCRLDKSLICNECISDHSAHYDELFKGTKNHVQEILDKLTNLYEKERDFIEERINFMR